MRPLLQFSAFLLIFSFAVSAPQPLGAVVTDSFRDEFNSISYGGDDGTQSWAGEWWDSEDQDPSAGGISVDSDAAVDFILWFATGGSGEYAERTADLSAYDSATLSFDYRRRNTDSSFSLKVLVSANGPAGPFTEIFAIAPGNDSAYVGSGDLPITAHKSPSTTIRFSYEGDTGPGKDFYLDNVEISASAANLPPVAVDDSASTAIGIPVTIDVLANDSDPDLDPMTVDSVTQGSSGSVVNNGTDVTYTPNSGWSGVDTFTYTVTDGSGGFDTATVTVDVNGVCYVVGDGGGGSDTLAWIDMNTSLEAVVGATGTSGVTAAAFHPITGTLFVSLPDQLGTVDTGTGWYTPTGSPFGGGFDNVQGIAFDTDGTLYAFHNLPSAEDRLFKVDSATGAHIPDAFGPGIDSENLASNWLFHNSAFGIGINDAGDMYGVTHDGTFHATQWIDKTDGSAYGLAVIPASVDVSFDALQRYWRLTPSGALIEPIGGGSHTLTQLTSYQAVACEGGPVNQAPSASDDPASTPEDIAVTIDVLGNDSDPDTDPLTVDSVIQGTNGSVVNNGADVTYTPNLNWNGTDTFTYTVTDGNGGFATAQVTVSVSAQPDPPDAVDDTDSTSEDLAVTVDVLGNDSDPDGDPVSITAVTQGSNGSVVNNGTDVTYNPDPAWFGIDTFTYTISDGNGGFDTATVTVDVGAGNDDPLAVDDNDSTSEDIVVTVDVLGNDSDPDGDGLLVDSVTQGSTGSVVNNGTDVAYTPSLDWNGTDTFTYTVTDGNGGFATAQVTVTVNAQPDPPDAVDDIASTVQDTDVYVWVLSNDSDPDLDALSVFSVTDGAHGTVTNHGFKVTYTPESGWTGVDTFTYTVTDGNGGFDTATATVTVAPGNQPPVAVDDTAGTLEDIAVVVDVLANDSDPEGEGLSVDSVTHGANGSVTNNGTGVTYTPDLNWSGTDTFAYTATDLKGGFATARVTITVAPAPDAPVAVDDIWTLDGSSSEAIPVLANDSDPDGDPLTIAGVIDGTHGTVTNNGSDVTYVPEPGWSGIDTFTYTVTDGNGRFDSAVVTVEVTAGPNRPPVAADDSAATDEDVPVTVAVLGNDSDPDGNALTVAGFNQGAHGSVSSTAGAVTYTPEKDWSGIDSFSYTVSDGVGGSATAAVIVTVKPVNDAPVARDDYATVQGSGIVAVSVLANDSDADGDPLAVTRFTQGSHGVTVADGTSVSYSPSSGWSGTDSFTYTVTDGHGGTDSAVVVVVVDVPNQAPVISIDSPTETGEGDQLVVAISTSDPDGDQVTISAIDLPDWASLVDEGDGNARIVGTPGFDDDGSYEITVSASDGQVTVTERLTVEVVDVNRPPEIEPIAFSGVNEDGSFTFTISSSDPDGDPLTITADGLPSWASLTDNGNGRAVISSSGVPNDAVGSFSVLVQVADGVHTATANLVRPISGLRDVRPPELTHRVFEFEEGDTLVATALKPRVASPDPPEASLSPREGLMVAFGSAVETLRSQILPALILGVVMAWMLMIGVGRVKDEEEST